MKIAILITSFNRRDLTLLCLKKLAEQMAVENLQTEIFLVDDASSDGTSDAVRQCFPSIHLIKGNGKLFWNGGMRVAFSAALVENFDAYLWLNDDTLLQQDALKRLVYAYRHCAMQGQPSILVGSFCDAVTGHHNYGGLQKHRDGIRVNFRRVLPDQTRLVGCDTMNGNFTLIPATIVEQLGNLESAFTHHFGDWDYGLRATRLGVPVLVMPGYFGTCPNNSLRGTWLDKSAPFMKRWKHLLSPKGMPPREWLLYTKRHYGKLWPLYVLSPYVKTILNF